MPYLHADLHPTIRERDFRKNTDLLGRDITIVMPCLNEAETLETCISDSHAALREAEICGEVLIADNGSTDGSLEIARQSVARVVDVAQRGYGAAVQSGIAAARSEFIVMGDGGWGMGDGGWGMGDGDGSYNLADARLLVEKLREGYDLVMGNRFLAGIEPGAMPWHHRYVGNPVLSGIGRLFFRYAVRDFHGGVQGFRMRAERRPCEE